MKVWRAVRAALSARRVVKSGSPPLYWQLLVAAVVSGALQLVYGAPESVSRQGGNSVDYMFLALQLTGAVVALGSLYMEEGSTRHAERLYWSLAFEAFGLIILTTAAVVYAVAVWYNNGRPPSSMGTWFIIMFGVWSVRTRLPQIWRALQELRS
ncbi:membrane protein [Gordonia phage CaiB]|nr:membrane protein [Gordonia phage AnarQue]UOW93002.1 membrane protein [Gordonia phage CaiB]